MARKHYSNATKISILREHLLESVPVSEVCEKHGIHPTVFYRWQKTFFENGEAAFEKTGRRKQNDQRERKTAALEEKVRQKDEVLAELMAEHVALKKKLGET